MGDSSTWYALAIQGIRLGSYYFNKAHISMQVCSPFEFSLGT